MTQRTILLFGATGNIGGHAARFLARRGDVKVRAAVRPGSRANVDRLERAGVEIVRADLGDAASLAKAFAGVEGAFLVNSLFAADEMEAHTRSFLDAARAAGVKRIVRSGIAPFPPCALADRHEAAQAAFCAAGIPWALVRPSLFDTNLFWSAPTIKDHGAFYLPFAGARVAWTDPSDVGEVVAHALSAPDADGKTFHVTGPELLGGAEVAEQLGAAIAAAKHDRYALARKQFDQLDTNQDGVVSADELDDYLLGAGFTNAEIRTILAAADSNGDGVISFDEFTRDAERLLDHQPAAASAVSYVAVGDAAARDAMTRMGVPDRAIELLLGLYARVRDGGAARLGDGVKHALDRDPTPFRRWADAHVAMFIPTHWEGLRDTDIELRPSSLG